MPFEVIWEPRGVVKRYWGHLSKAEHQASTNDLFSNPRFDKVHYVINDFSKVESHGIDEDELENYTACRIGDASYQPDIRGALVAVSPEMRALCELIVSPKYATPHETRIFFTMAEARKWLGC